MSSIRDKNWANHIIRYAREVKGEPFVWGETDCATIVIRAVNKMYPEPLIEGIQYNSIREAKEFYEGVGIGKVLEEAQSSPVRLSKATCGDVLVGENQTEGLPSVVLMLRRCILTSDVDNGVVVAERSFLDDKTYEAYRLPV